MKKVKFITLGCKVNQYETEAAMELFEKAGYKSVENELADVYVINTCTVTGLSDSKSRQMIRKAIKNKKDSIIVVMGCYSQVSPEEVLEIDGVDIVIGTTERSKIVELVNEYEKNKNKINIVRDIKNQNEFQPINIEKLKGMTRAYIKIQDGCNQFCSYCIIPYARGRVRSRNPKEIIEEVKRLSQYGFKEVIITGIHIASYGKDLENYKLIDLIKEISKTGGIERIRLGSIEPNLIDENFLKEISKLKNFCDQFHLSLQSGSNSVLKRMNRKYTTDEYEEKVNLIRKYFKNPAVTTDIIVGFPQETCEEFEETLNFVNKIKFSRVHVFKYSKREGTPAAKMKNQVPENIKKERSKILIDLTKKLKFEFEKNFLGESLDVLFENKKNDKFIGHTKNYMEVKVESDANIVNKILKVKITDADEDGLIGKIIWEGNYE